MTPTLDKTAKTKLVLEKQSKKIYNITVDGKAVVSGRTVFDNMNERGLPLDIQLIQLDILTNSKFAISWVEFVDRGDEVGWMVYQIYDRIKYALKECDLYDDRFITETMKRVMIHVCRTIDGFSHCLTETETTETPPVGRSNEELYRDAIDSYMNNFDGKMVSVKYHSF